MTHLFYALWQAMLSMTGSFISKLRWYSSSAGDRWIGPTVAGPPVELPQFERLIDMAGIVRRECVGMSVNQREKLAQNHVLNEIPQHYSVS